MKRVAILGSTGSVGTQTLDVVASHPGRFEIVALAAGANTERLAEQVRQFRPKRVSVASAAHARDLRARLAAHASTDSAPAPIIDSGDAGLVAVATEPADLVMAALVGAVGLEPTLAAVRAGRDIALANKEVMVMAGALVRRELEKAGGALLPVDSEHSAIFQALAGHRREDVDRLILTCSGGPFRTWSAERIAAATIDDALAHPNWDMGAKITIDSASLMNKGLEVIEARWLFDVPPERIDVVVHPESIVHSLVEYVDGSVMAQLGLPDMRVPIAVAMGWPAHLPLDVPKLRLAEIGTLNFEEPDRVRFPNLQLAFDALRGSEAAPAVVNAANEIAVAAFLDGAIAFPEIAATNRAVLDLHLGQQRGVRVDDLSAVRAADAWARDQARRRLTGRNEGLTAAVAAGGAAG